MSYTAADRAGLHHPARLPVFLEPRRPRAATPMIRRRRCRTRRCSACAPRSTTEPARLRIRRGLRGNPAIVRRRRSIRFVRALRKTGYACGEAGLRAWSGSCGGLDGCGHCRDGGRFAAAPAMMHAAVAQTIEEESDRIPGLPEPSIAHEPAARARRSRRRALRTRPRAASTSTSTTSARCSAIRRAASPRRLLRRPARACGRSRPCEAIGWPGLSFFANGYQIHGQSISADDLGVLMPVSFIEADPATRLFELWLDQKLYGGKAVDPLRPACGRFRIHASQGGQAFLNGTWGWPSIAGLNMPQDGPAYPMATPGVRARASTRPTTSLPSSVFSTANPAGNCAARQDPQECNPNGLLFPLDASTAADGRGRLQARSGRGRLAGTVKLGAYANTGEFRHQRVITGGVRLNCTREPPHVVDGDWALSGRRSDALPPARRRGPERRGGVRPRHRRARQPQPGRCLLGGGPHLQWHVAARPNDTLAIGYAYTGISSDITERRARPRRPIVSSYEALIEASYMAEIVPGLSSNPTSNTSGIPAATSPIPTTPTGNAQRHRPRPAYDAQLLSLP